MSHISVNNIPYVSHISVNNITYVSHTSVNNITFVSHISVNNITYVSHPLESYLSQQHYPIEAYLSQHYPLESYLRKTILPTKVIFLLQVSNMLCQLLLHFIGLVIRYLHLATTTAGTLVNYGHCTYVKTVSTVKGTCLQITCLIH